MFNIRYLTVGFIVASSWAYIYSANAPAPIVLLKSDAMRIVKNFIDVTKISDMDNFRRQIRNILLGKLQADRTRKGDYEFEGNFYGVQGLQEQEALLEAHKDSMTPAEYADKKRQLTELLEKAKQDFKDKAEQFRSVRHTKKIMEALIIESLTKRDRHDSILLSWTQSKSDEDEERIFHEEVLTFKIFEEFLTDLYNFLGDLIDNCPEVKQQHEQQVKKFNQVRKFSASFPKNEIKSFLVYIKNNYLEKLKLEEISQEKVKHLYDLYIKSKK